MSTSLINEDDDLGPEISLTFDPLIYRPDSAPDSPIHYNLRTSSYSSKRTLHSCARRFELNRLLPRTLDVEVDEDEFGHLDFGSIVGIGIQELLVSNNMDKAFFSMFLAWKDNLESERGLDSKKTFWHALQAVRRFTELMIGPLAQYELAYYQGKPAVELGFSVNCGGGFTYRGKLDALLIHKTKRMFLPVECKTTKNAPQMAQYGKSDQAIGYGVVIDRVAHEMEMEYNSYNVVYPVYSTARAEWYAFFFHKSNSDRALWLQSLMIDRSHVEQYHELEYFPTNGEACYSFGRQCKYYDTDCGMSNFSLGIGDPKKIEFKLDKIAEFPLEFDIDELIEAQIARREEGKF